MHGIDLKDRKLIYYLARNSREGFSKLAALIGVSKNSVKYRVDRLKKLGVIDRFLPIINIGLLEWNTFDIFLRLRAKPEEEGPIIEFLKARPYMVWMASLSGEWDMILEVAVKDWNMYAGILADISGFLGERLDRYETIVASVIYKVVPLVRDFYEDLDLPELEKKRVWGFVKLDETDRNILWLLSQDGLMPLYKIATQVGLSPDSVAYRMKKLEKEGVIVSYIPDIDLGAVGYNQYIVIINLKSIPPEKLELLRNYLTHNKNIQYGFQGATRLEIFLNVYTKTPEEIDNLLKDIKSRFFEHIQDYKYMLVTKNHVYTLFPENIFKGDKNAGLN